VSIGIRKKKRWPATRTKVYHTTTLVAREKENPARGGDLEKRGKGQEARLRPSPQNHRQRKKFPPRKIETRQGEELLQQGETQLREWEGGPGGRKFSGGPLSQGEDPTEFRKEGSLSLSTTQREVATGARPLCGKRTGSELAVAKEGTDRPDPYRGERD